jgi:hypothetical protein
MIKRHRNCMRWLDIRIVDGSSYPSRQSQGPRYPSLRNLKAIIYPIAGKLELALPT